ncbi:hypothetical protein I5L01_09665 [Erythrobacter sp. YJ-T3-07]|nr:hypothetical protein [Erythrobacter sp. YJ-T3-07]MBH1944497.1 hypothetical protein [Erythrobacter sp. YJ-T3-07]
MATRIPNTEEGRQAYFKRRRDRKMLGKAIVIGLMLLVVVLLVVAVTQGG